MKKINLKMVNRIPNNLSIVKRDIENIKNSSTVNTEDLINDLELIVKHWGNLDVLILKINKASVLRNNFIGSYIEGIDEDGNCWVQAVDDNKVYYYQK